MHNIHILDSQYLHELFWPDLSHSSTLDLVRLEHRIRRLSFRLPVYSSTSTSTTPYRYGHVGQGDSDLDVILDQVKHKHCRLGSKNLNNPIYIDCSRVFCHLGVESCGLPGEGEPTMTSSILILTTQSSLQTSPSICLLDYHLMPRYSLYFHQFLENFSYIFITFILRNIFCGFSFFHINGIIMVRSWDLNSIINACGFIFQFHLQQSSQHLFSLYIRFKPILLTAILTFIWTTSPKIYSHFNSKFKHFSEIFFSATFLPRLPDGTNFSSQFLRT